LATAVTIQYLSPVFTAIFAVFLLSEKMKPRQWLFYLISFCGVVLIKKFDTRVDVETLLIGVASALLAGFAYNCVRKLKDYDHPVVVIFYFPLVTLPIITPFTIANWVPPQNWEEWGLILSVGILTQLAQLNMTKAFQAEKLGNVANIGYLATVLALVFGYFIFDEMFGAWSLVGMALVLAGVGLNVFYGKISFRKK
jgi:drug/metabolite transporter (DMT)-like permease